MLTRERYHQNLKIKFTYLHGHVISSKPALECFRDLKTSFILLVGEDKDRDALGIAVVSAKETEIGEWQYLDSSGAWQTINVDGQINEDGVVMGETAQLLFLPPDQKIRFKPLESTKLWTIEDAMDHTTLRFLLWDQTDELGLGVDSVALQSMLM